MSEIRWTLNEAKPTVLAVSETWADTSVTDQELHVEGYSLVRKDRDRKGGGVCLYISDKIPHNVREDLQHTKLEGIWIELYLPKTKPILVGVCYRPPKDEALLDNFEEVRAKSSIVP